MNFRSSVFLINTLYPQDSGIYTCFESEVTIRDYVA